MTLFFSSLYHSSLTLYEVNNTVALLRNVLFCDHLDRLLCNYTSHEGGGVWNIGGGGTNTEVKSVVLKLMDYLTYSSPTAFLRAISSSSEIWAPPNNTCTSASSSSSVGASGPEF